MTLLKIHSDFITVGYDNDGQYVFHKIHRAGLGDGLQDALNTGIDLLKAHHTSRYLSDDRQGGPVTPERIAWALYDWLPRALDAGFQHWALVVPDDVAVRTAMQPLIEAYWHHGVNVSLFTTVAAAHDWLTQQ